MSSIGMDNQYEDNKRINTGAGGECDTLRIKVYGIVQGVGFRPTVARHADDAKITGTVCNKGPYVEIYARGTDEQLSHFIRLLEERPPKRAAILKMSSLLKC